MTEPLSLATLNTRGLPLDGTRIAERFAAIAAEYDAGDADVVCLQEVYAYRLLTLLRRAMPSFPYVAYRRSLSGPAGGLVTFSRLPLTGTSYRRLPMAPLRPRIPFRARLNALHCGVLSTRVVGCRILNIHPAANTDGDWSDQNRFRALQAAQFAALARSVTAGPHPTIVCGDFNLASTSTLHADLRRRTSLRDAFGGQCPPTFHAEFLPPDRRAHCIDFILVPEVIQVEATGLLFTGKQPLPSGANYLSDHVGLLARLRLPGLG